MRFKKFSCIISLALVVVVLCSALAPSAYAAYLPGSGPLGGGLGWISAPLSDWIVSQGFDWIIGNGFSLANYIKSLYDDSVCELSGNGRHEFEARNLTGSDSGMRYVCKYCGELGSQIFQEDYNTSYVSEIKEELGTTQITMAGKLLWSPELSQIRFDNGVPGSIVTVYPGNAYDVSSLSISFSSSSSYNDFSCYTFIFNGVFPIDGFYDYISGSFSCNLQYYEPSHSFKNVIIPFSSSPGISGLVHAGESSRDLEFYYQRFNIRFSVGTVYFTLPVYAVTPLSGLIDIQHDETYSPDTRAASFTGDIGIIGDNGNLTKVEGDQIFNETTNNYYNPTTGDTTTVTDWYYDYSDRSYHLTTEEGDTVTVTYGDENITIQEGDTTYNVYYIIDMSASTDPCPEGGGHDWQTTETVPATCTMAGSQTQTCSKCGQTKTTTLPALGHKWTVKQSVQTKYDETGQLLQEGYTIYECERCGEEYKDTASTGPPPVDPGGGSSGGDSGEGDSLWDSIVDFFKSIAASFTSLPEWFSRFSEFLSSAFSYLPDEIVLLLTFGVFAVVGIGIWKAVRR